MSSIKISHGKALRRSRLCKRMHERIVAYCGHGFLHYPSVLVTVLQPSETSILGSTKVEITSRRESSLVQALL